MKNGGEDFINKLGISRREARESRYWLRLIEAAANCANKSVEDEIQWLINESKEIMLILSSIIKNTKGG
ncbi:MAG: four helix bundle protein [Candidatus Omnitrophica bacterium]|nr:four helix bundle protein [Candidatus Omnitrophota bacterium]